MPRNASAGRSRQWLALPRARLHLWLLLCFIASRALLCAAGLRFKLDLAWMFLSDLGSLRDRFFETVYYFHAFAPGMNVLTGLLVRLPESWWEIAATVPFWISGWLLVASLCELFCALGVQPRVAAALGLIFSLLPQSLYLENLYLYTQPCAALVCAAAVLLLRGLGGGRIVVWSAFFFTCAVLGWLYTTFHLFWFCAMAAASVALAPRGTRSRVCACAVLPFLLILAPYAKNWAVFGVFGTTSWGGANLTLATTQIMHKRLRSQWISEGKLSPYANISVFAPPQRYLPLFPKDLHFPWPGSNELWRPSVNAANFNHGLFLEVNRVRRDDAVYYIKARPREYLRNVFERNLQAFFSSTTHWHIADHLPSNPHHQHREILGGYERLYDRLVHGFPAPVGLYVFVLPLFLWAPVHVFRGFRSGEPLRRTRAIALGFSWFQLAFIGGVSCLFSSIESARYRYTVEPFIWAIAAAALVAGTAKLREVRALKR